MKIVALYFALVAVWWVIVFKLVELGHMKTLLLLIALLALPCPHAAAQGTDAPEGTSVASAVVSGYDVDRLTPALRRDIDALVGTPLSASTVDALARRLEAEHPETVVAVRSVLSGDNRARVIFLVATKDNSRDSDENVNARYIVESVAVEGVAESRLSQSLRDDLHAMAGVRFDHRAAEGLLRRVRDELPGYDVTRRMSRGTERGRLRMVILVQPGEGMRWLHFEPSTSKFLYHTEQGWSGLLDLNIGRRDFRVSPIVAIDNADDLVEENSGFGVRVEARNVGTEELGFAIALATYDADWRDATRASLPPGSAALLYDRRSTVAPSLSLAFTPHLYVTGGVSITQLEPDESVGGPSRAANAWVGLVGYDQRWNTDRVRQHLDATFGVRAASGSLESDLDYERYVGRAVYRVRWGRNQVVASGLGGGISGDAPLFERFTLGDSSTLRGWDKYKIAPLGGDRVGHGSIEYRYRPVAVFLDGGSVWNRGEDARTRFATGFGLHVDNFFATLAFPLNTDDVRTTFMIGVRF
jgi:surface antigen Omp85-like protein